MRRERRKVRKKETRREEGVERSKGGAGEGKRGGRGREEARTNCESFLIRYFQKLYASLE